MLYCRPPLPFHVEGLQALEQRAEWRAAADRLRSSLSGIRPEDYYSIARAEETIAYFLLRSALQAENRADFDRTISEAMAVLDRAGEHHAKSGAPNSRISASSCRAKGHFLLAWVSGTPSRAKLLLEAYSSLQAISTEIVGLDDQELQLSLLGDLLLYALEWSSTVPYSNSSAASVTSLLDLVDKVLGAGSNKLLEERARILSLVSQLSRQVSFWTQGTPVEAELSRKAVLFARLSQEANGSDPFLTAAVDILLGQTLADFESEPRAEESLWQCALKIGRDLNDRYLTALSCSLLCYNAAWKLAEAEEPEQASKLAEECFRLGDEAVRNGCIIRFHHATGSTQAGPISNAYYLLTLSEPDRAKRQLLRYQAVENAKQAIEAAKASGSLFDISNAYHSLSRSMEASCLEEPDDRVRREKLTDALALRRKALDAARLAVPAGTWTHGVQLHYLATLLSELAEFEHGSKRQELLSRALKASTTCLESCSVGARGSEQREKYGVNLARYFESHGRLLEQLHSENGKRVLREDALAAYRRAGQIYAERRLSAHSASALWHSATISHLLGAHEDSGREFGQSAEYYSILEMDTPRLAGFFHELASYMNAWSQVEHAHGAHARGEYAIASDRYRQASVLLKDSRRDYLSMNFLAWASLENAEDLSRRERTEESSKAFQDASSLFDKSQNEISGRLSRIEDPEEKSLAKQIATFGGSHGRYCLARGLLEQGRVEELAGEYVAASRLYDRATGLLEETLNRLPEGERSDLLLALNLAKGLSALCTARAESDPGKYLRAATFFKSVARESSNVRTGQYAMGNRFLSEALASETKLAANAEPRFYRIAKRNLRSASICYSRANMDHSSQAVDARLSLLDASLYATKAEASPNPGTRMQNLSLAEKCLRHALRLYHKAGDLGNQQEVGKLLEKVSERKRLGRLLRGTLEHAIVTSPSSLLSGPTHGPESAVGVNEIEQRIVQGQLGLPDEVSDDAPFTINLDLVNVGNVPVSLLQLRDLLPSAVKVVKVISGQRIEDGFVNLAGKRLPPKGVESISMDCLSPSGLLEFRPRILYLDNQGKPKAHQVATTARQVLGHAAFEFEAPNSGAIFQFLASEFVRDYMARHVAAEGSGWRSLPIIVGKTGLPRSAVYSPRGLGTPLAELVRRGLVEVRVFSSQPGRGGRAQRARVCYEKNPVRVFVDRLAMKTSEKPNPIL